MQETEAPEDTPAGLASGRYRSKYAMIATAIDAAPTATMTARGEQSILRIKRRVPTARWVLPPFFLPRSRLQASGATKSGFSGVST